MAVRPGEENVATLFGDVHYFYGEPTADPPHHRFDKGSYVYLFENAHERRARIEVANKPGSDDQDAFDGYLDSTQLHYSYKHTNMVTLTVGEVDGHEEWHLPTFDPNNRSKYHYPLHSLDIYFWTQTDALAFVNGIRRVLPPAQCDIVDEPGPPPRHSGDVSSVVQKLERAAITDSSSGSTPPYGQPANGAGIPTFAGPPISAVSGTTGPTPPPPAAPPVNYAPVAYNPAAPAAPEQIRHREKTPPPEDGGYNPLHQTLAHDATTPFSPGLVPSGRGPLSPGVPPPQFHQSPGAPSFPGPPQNNVASPGLPPAGFGSLGGHAHPGLSRAATMPVHGMQSPGLASPFGVGGYPGSPAYAHTPTPPITSPGLPPPPSSVPQAGYGYGGGNPPGTPGASEYNIHQQFYVPEGGGSVKYKQKTEARGRLEENAGRLERGVTGMFKKFEKKFG